jgi:3-isopropylmalate/(R)-2-methylmalate dehydratase large subunit
MAPDEATYEYLAGRPYAPKGALFDKAVTHWRKLPSDEDVVFDAEHTIHVPNIAPQITWGTSPQDVIDVTGRIPDPSNEADPERRKNMEAALKYMGCGRVRRLKARRSIGFLSAHAPTGDCRICARRPRRSQAKKWRRAFEHGSSPAP